MLDIYQQYIWQSWAIMETTKEWIKWKKTGLTQKIP